MEREQSKRADRRAQRIKYKERLKNRYITWYKGTKYFTEDNAIEYANHHWQNAKKCSCWMCGNNRKYFNETTNQEKLSDIDAIEELIEFYSDNDIDDDKDSSAFLTLGNEELPIKTKHIKKSNKIHKNYYS